LCVFYKKNFHVFNKWINKYSLKFALIAAVKKKKKKKKRKKITPYYIYIYVFIYCEYNLDHTIFNIYGSSQVYIMYYTVTKFLNDIP